MPQTQTPLLEVDANRIRNAKTTSMRLIRWFKNHSNKCIIVTAITLCLCATMSLTTSVSKSRQLVAVDPIPVLEPKDGESFEVTPAYDGGWKKPKMGDKIEFCGEVEQIHPDGSMTIILPSGTLLDIAEKDTKPMFFKQLRPKNTPIANTVSDQLNLKRIDHVALIVKDLKKSVEFYTNVLNLRLEKSPTLGNPVAWLSLGTHIQLHLIQSDAAAYEAIHDPRNPLANNHIAILTGDLDETSATLQTEGYELVEQLDFNTRWDDETKIFQIVDLKSSKKEQLMRQIIIRDPTGHTIELCECNELRVLGY